MNTTKKTKAAETSAVKPVARGFIPFKDEKGEDRWIEAGPVWETKDGESHILDVQAVPLKFLTEGLPEQLRILIKPVQQDD